MLTGELKSKIDRVWEAFWTGGLSNPLTVIEQMTYLLFIRRLDELQTTKEQKASWTGQPITDPLFTEGEKELRWSQFKDLDPEVMFRTFTKPDGVFDFLRNVGNRSAAFSKFMKGATFMIPTPRLLAQVVEMISNIDMGDRDTKGDVYEYLLSKIASAGQNGQFRTPRHIIRMMVDMVQPTIEDVICDPSSGTCGFLTVAVLSLVDSKKTELLFLALILRGLKLGGRAAVIVPDGVLFGSSNAHLQIRKELIDHQKLQAVISMPSGVFKPYAGVSTAVLLFTKTDSGGTDNVWFYDMQADGFSLDDKRQPIEKNDIPDIIKKYHAFQEAPSGGLGARTDKSFVVPVAEIRENKYDLSINRYKEVVYEQKTYAKPAEIIADIETLDEERAVLLNQLKELLV